MRDHRRRTEIRLIVLKEAAARIAMIVREGRQVIILPDRGAARAALAWHAHRIGYFSNLPKEFRDVNPTIPWERLRRLRYRSYPSSIAANRRSFASLWRFVSEEVPRIARQLSHPKFPPAWKDEPHGHLGIADVLGPHRAEIRYLLRKHHVRRLRVYGSVARGEADDRSDVDLLVQWQRRERRNNAARLASELEELLDRRVQVYTEAGIYWAVRDRVLSEATEFR